MNDLEVLVEAAKGGDREALDRVVTAVRDPVYGLALRMLWHPEDAEDATQEILIRVITHLGGFRGESSFRTWVLRVAANALRTTRRRRAERPEITFEAFGEDLATGLAPDREAEAGAERRLLAEEVKVGCSHGMLLCLDRDHRLAYVLGEILELDGKEAAAALEISHDAYRKRLSRARARLEDFMKAHCGLVDPGNACRCHRRIDRAIELGRVDPEHLLFAGRDGEDIDGRTAAEEVLHTVEHLRTATAVFRSNPNPRAPDSVVEMLRTMLEGTAEAGSV